MAVTYLGSKTVGGVCLAIGLALPGLSAAAADIVSRVAELNAQITANASLAVPDPGAMALAIGEAAANALAAVVSLAAALPGAALEANVSLAGEIAALVGLRDLLTGVVGTLTAAASAGGLHLYRVDALASALGGELGAAVGAGLPGGAGGAARVQGVVLLTEDPAAHTALSRVLAT